MDVMRRYRSGLDAHYGRERDVICQMEAAERAASECAEAVRKLRWALEVTGA